MPAKSKSPEAAQRKVWKAELKTLEANRRKVAKDALNERKKAQLTVQEAMKALNTAKFAAERIHAKVLKKEGDAVKNIDRRIAILRGRIGL
jgi:hypothetical protein